jgi:hypothetical protein
MQTRFLKVPFQLKDPEPAAGALRMYLSTPRIGPDFERVFDVAVSERIGARAAGDKGGLVGGAAAAGPY